MNEESRQWLEHAQQDLRAAEVLLDAGIWNQVCFHAQQCVEKLFKAAIVAEGRLYPRSHNLIGLLNALDGVKFPALAALTDQIRLLDRFYTSTRYPDLMPGAWPSGLPGGADAAAALALARQVTEIISDALHATGAQ
jgi:HEPN domain-containing protein